MNPAIELDRFEFDYAHGDTECEELVFRVTYDKFSLTDDEQNEIVIAMKQAALTVLADIERRR